MLTQLLGYFNIGHCIWHWIVMKVRYYKLLDLHLRVHSLTRPLKFRIWIEYSFPKSLTIKMRKQLQISHLVRLTVRVLREQDLCLLLQNRSYCLTKAYLCRNCFCNVVRHFRSLSKTGTFSDNHTCPTGFCCSRCSLYLAASGGKYESYRAQVLEYQHSPLMVSS